MQSCGHVMWYIIYFCLAWSTTVSQLFNWKRQVIQAVVRKRVLCGGLVRLAAHQSEPFGLQLAAWLMRPLCCVLLEPPASGMLWPACVGAHCCDSPREPKYVFGGIFIFFIKVPEHSDFPGGAMLYCESVRRHTVIPVPSVHMWVTLRRGGARAGWNARREFGHKAVGRGARHPQSPSEADVTERSHDQLVPKHW